MFEYFYDMLRFGAFYRKNGVKTSDFRDLLLEGEIFIVGTQNLPQMIFIRMSMIIQCFVLVWNVSDPCCEWFWGKNL